MVVGGKGGHEDAVRERKMYDDGGGIGMMGWWCGDGDVGWGMGRVEWTWVKDGGCPGVVGEEMMGRFVGCTDEVSHGGGWGEGGHKDPPGEKPERDEEEARMA